MGTAHQLQYPLAIELGIHAVPAEVELFWSVGALQPVTITCNQWRQTPAQITDEIVAIKQLQDLLQAAIERQIQNLLDEHVGVFLSGGLDSSIAAALLVQNGIKVRTYTLDFGEAGISEQPYAEQVASHLQIPLIKIPVNPKLVRKAVNDTACAAPPRSSKVPKIFSPVRLI